MLVGFCVFMLKFFFFLGGEVVGVIINVFVCLLRFLSRVCFFFLGGGFYSWVF